MENQSKEMEVTKNIGELDVLGRQEFVDRMLLITETISRNNGNVSYALNGSWGVGKSFVLDMFERQIKVQQQGGKAKDRYSLFHYNCWNYDYYDEPLVAIVASMLDQIEENEKLIPDNLRCRVKATLKVIGEGLLSKAIDGVEDKTGIDAKDVVDAVTEIKSISDEQIKEKYTFDTYFAFKKVLESLRDTFRDITKEKTIIFVVDELDRCLPEYAIKVLERLHHMFEDIPNIQLIISVDKNQFARVINQIFGDSTNVDKYLAKFIDFEMNLDEGGFNAEFDSRFEYYLNHFDYISDGTYSVDIAEFKSHIFDGMDMRSRIKLIDKCNLLHNILNLSDEKKDFAFMCVEVSFMVMKYWGVDLLSSKPRFNIRDVFTGSKHNNGNGLDLINEKVQSKNGILYYSSRDDGFGDYTEYLRRSDIWGVILTCYRYVVGYDNDNLRYDDNYCEIGLREYSESYRDLIYAIS